MRVPTPKPRAPVDVCIVSSSSLASGPRVEKEADALCAAGYRVAVVVMHTLDWMSDWDARLAAGKAYRLHALDHRSVSRNRHPMHLAALGTQRSARMVSKLLESPHAALAALSCSDRVLPLARAAAAVPARLYIGHNLPALPAALLAARMRGVRFAFDAEDDHYGELPTVQQRGIDGRLSNAVLASCLPRAAYVSAASAGIADALSSRYAIARPMPVLNVFPLALRAALDGQRKDRRGDALSVCWYSQTVGLDRGLQDAVIALGMLRGHAQLHIRGHATSDVERALRDLAQRHGVAHALHFHPQVHPDELLSRIAEHDIGLALEQPVNDNRLIAVTNKLFFYMLAGLAVIATDTPGQRGIWQEAGGAFELYAPGDTAGLARCLQRLHDDRALLATQKARMLELALTRYHAERELQKLPALVEAALTPA